MNDTVAHARTPDTRRPTPPHLVRWLETQLTEWETEGLITGDQRVALRGRYVPARRLELAHIIVGIGTAFVAVGLLWFVATNYDELSPLLRFVCVAALWLGLAGTAEALAARRPAAPALVTDAFGESARDTSMAPTLVAVCRTLAAAAFGAVIFQAAQSLQVPAFEPRLVGFWAIGAIVYAYATASRGALGIGLVASVVWFGWFVADLSSSTLTVVGLILAAGLVATSVAVAHVPQVARLRPGFAGLWRLVGAGLTLAGLFVAALPFGADAAHGPVPSSAIALWIVAALVAITSVALCATLTRRSTSAWFERAAEVVAAALAIAAGLALCSWQPGDPLAAGAGAGAWAHAIVAVLVFVAAAAWFAVGGVLTDSGTLTGIALAALVVFVTAQSFAVFAPLFSGAVLFLVLGLVLVATGLLAERLRRVLVRLVAARTRKGDLS